MITFPREREPEKLKKEGGSMVQEQVLVKEKDGGALFLFIAFKFRNYSRLSKVVLCI